MSRASTSLDLSELFNNDDSHGHRLLEFLQKRRGSVRRRNFLFMDCEPQRLSLNVQLEKLPNSQEEANCQNNEAQKKTSKKGTCSRFSIESENQPCAAAERSAPSNVTEVLRAPSDPRLIEESASPISPTKPKNQVSSCDQINYFKNLSLRALSPRVSSIRKSGVVSPSDKLRRYSLKRLTNLCGGKRTLLREFEGTIGDTDFEPPICSTPLSQIQQEIQPSTDFSRPLQIGMKPNSPSKNTNTNETHSSNRDTLLSSLQCKDKEIKGCMEHIIERTLKQIQCLDRVSDNTIKDKTECTNSHTSKSELKRTYTMEKGTVLGQIILTPEKCTNDVNLQSSPPMLLNIGSAESSNKGVTNVINITNLQKSPNIPETRDIPKSRKSSIIIRSDIEETQIVVPVNQTLGRNCEEVTRNNVEDKSKNNITNNSPTSPGLPVQQVFEGKVDQCDHLTSNCLKITDILTEDEDATAIAAASPSVDNNSQVPLNLAHRISNLKERSLRKRSTLRLVDYHLHSSDSEIYSPNSQSNSRMMKRKHIPLNSAPGVPLNGEKFAAELERMSYNDILDLRKRNSMGRVFEISGKSRRLQDVVAKKQIELNHQIEKELLKRNLNEKSDKTSAKSDEGSKGDDAKKQDQLYHHIEKERNFGGMPQENEINGENEREKEKDVDYRESSLLGETPSDRVSFRNKTIRRSARTNEKKFPEVLKQYLNVSKKITQKSNKKIINHSKRSLYTQGYSDSEECKSTVEEANLDNRSSRSGINKRSMPYMPSPPKSVGIKNKPIKIVSPPPPLNISIRKSTQCQQPQSNRLDENSHDTTINVYYNVALPPPPGFEIETDNTCVNHSIINSTVHASTEITNAANLNTNHNADNDDNQIFKKPNQPALKMRGRKRKINKNSSKSTAEPEQSDNSIGDSTDGALRRSKRGHVPAKVPIFQILFQQSLGRSLENLEKKKKKQREISKADMKNIEGNKKNPISKTNLPNKNRMQKQISSISENEPLSAIVSQDFDAVDSKKMKKNESKVVRKKTHKKIIRPNENIEYSASPPIDHPTNVFDQLRVTGSTTNTISPPNPTMESIPGPSLKSVKVRVARLKSLAQPIQRFDSTDTISSDINKHANFELISLLKNIKEPNSFTANNSEIFKEMKISSISNLSFTELQGVEYAFYDTDDKASLGYLRFKPRQIKPKKRAKRFHLHFVVLVGNFRITANNEEIQIGAGDMVAIEKLVYYDIENLTEDIGILMVIKK